MRHDISLEGYGIRLRPVTFDDSEFIVTLRNMPHAVGKIGDSATTIDAQKKWLQGYMERQGDYYFIIESRLSIKLGTISVYNINFDDLIAEIGRTVVIPGSFAVIPASILLIDFCFHQLKMETLVGCVVSTNKEVIRFNQQLGYIITKIVPQELSIGGCYVDMVHIQLTLKRWLEHREQLVKYAIAGERFQVA